MKYDTIESIRSWTIVKAFWISIIVFSIGALTPSKEGLIKAYFIVEGSKVVNAPNADKFAKELSKKADDLIKAIEKR